MKMILVLAAIFVVYEIGYSIGYRHCVENIQEIIDEYKESKSDLNE